jgi:hypothetical protein
MADSNQIRINELARELEVKAKVLIDFLPEIGVTEKKTHSSSLDLEHAELARKHFAGLAAKEAAAEAEKQAKAPYGYGCAHAVYCKACRRAGAGECCSCCYGEARDTQCASCKPSGASCWNAFRACARVFFSDERSSARSSNFSSARCEARGSCDDCACGSSKTWSSAVCAASRSSA